ncbi:MAG: hypothetical protein CR997_08925 [Acidobacteria bacterium]|nr:MAG: hypothetical protein CR997_08925 [Acidobacteriota bacterium]
MSQVQVLKRKQFLISEEHIQKLAVISKKENVSATEIVRRSIDAYDPYTDPAGVEALLEMAIQATKEAIYAVREATEETLTTVQQLKQKRVNHV